jgi:hypothetical protein
VHETQTLTLPPEEEGEIEVEAACPAGKVLLGGAGNLISSQRHPSFELVVYNGPKEVGGSLTNTWLADYAMYNASSSTSWTLKVSAVAYCADAS